VRSTNLKAKLLPDIATIYISLYADITTIVGSICIADSGAYRDAD
jgi:hypothetical protein